MLITRMTRIFFLIAVVFSSVWIVSAHAGELLRRDYDGFTIWLDCSKKGAVMFRYNVQHDTGNNARRKGFYLDSEVPSDCQQTSNKAYKTSGQPYDRGHLIPANHLDYSKESIRQTNFMTNILPQASALNRGAWLLTEEITECYRDIDELLVVGGVLWGNNQADDYFVMTHGITTPDAFWKVIIRNDRVIAWVIPNSSEATKKHLDLYLVSIDEIEQITGQKIPVDDYLKHEKLQASWQIPLGCDKS